MILRPARSRYLTVAVLACLSWTNFGARAAETGARDATNITAHSDAAQVLEKPAAIRDAGQLKIGDPGSAIDAKIKSLGFDPTGIAAAIAAYRADHLDAGDQIAQRTNDPLVKATLEWVALRDVPQAIGYDRLAAFGAAHPDWSGAWLRHQMETRLLRVSDPIVVERFFTDAPPETVPGKLALAKALKATGRVDDATKLARAVFRENTLVPAHESWLKAEFGGSLTKGDYKYRADRLLFQARKALALRYAVKAGPEALAVARAWAAPSDKAIANVPVSWRDDPGLVLVRAQALRHHGKLIEAAQLLRDVDRTRVKPSDGDSWWAERRALARDLLDAGKVNAAYITCALHTPASRESDVDAEFHAGWIALRFMHDSTRATYHFWAASKQAVAPTSIARIAYWQGRTAQESTDPAAKASAKGFYEKAAVNGSTYYGQLARQVLGWTNSIVQAPTVVAAGEDRAEVVRAVELLFAAGDKDSATELASEAAVMLTDSRQVAALAVVIASQQDAHLALTIGKLLGQRGMPVDPLAFPTFGIPPYKELANSAPAPIVYSVARQESAFTTHAVSGAGAKGLMQMIASTAKHTALKAGVSFNVTRLLRDAAFNAQLGAAHLGTLLTEQKGSLILTFAAYNAGGGRVQDWLKAYGDPRKPGVDPIDWVERIPFGETRNYVQRVMANVVMYTAIFADRDKTNLLSKAAGEARL